MTRWSLLLMTCAVALAPVAWAADAPPQAPRPSPPADARKAPEAADRGVVVVPPVTDPAAVATPPKNVDPEIHAKPPHTKNRKKANKERK